MPQPSRFRLFSGSTPGLGTPPQLAAARLAGRGDWNITPLRSAGLAAPSNHITHYEHPN